MPCIARSCAVLMPSTVVRKAPDEEAELKDIVDVIGAYEAIRWPLGKIAGGKG